MDQKMDLAPVLPADAPDDVHTPVRRAVVDKEEFDVGEGLLHQGAGAAPGIGLDLVDGYDDGNLHKLSFR